MAKTVDRSVKPGNYGHRVTNLEELEFLAKNNRSIIIDNERLFAAFVYQLPADNVHNFFKKGVHVFHQIKDI